MRRRDQAGRALPAPLDNNGEMTKRGSREADLIEVRPSDVHGQGVFAVTSISAGRLVGRYEGRRYTEAEASSKAWDDGLTYLFGLSDGTIIDGADGGNATRHLNHACTPNCQAVEHRKRGGELGIVIETIRSVRAGEELTLDYALQVDPASQDEHSCACGSANCRGSMLEARQSTV
jgi:SET domain-containing protein